MSDNEIMLGNITHCDSDSFSDASEGSNYLSLIDVFPEFGFDEERFLFDFDPPSCHSLTISYQKISSLAKMTSKLFGALKMRSMAGDLQDKQPLTLSKTSITSKLSGAYNKLADDAWFDGNHNSDNIDMNLYHLEHEDRAMQRAISVMFLLDAMEGEEEFEKLLEKVDRTVSLSEKALSHIVGRCLPMELPYPAMSIIISYLVDSKGLDQVGLLIADQKESNKDVEQDKEEENDDDDEEDDDEEETVSRDSCEIEIILHLYWNLSGIYDHIKFIMFKMPDDVWKIFIRGCKERFEKRLDEMAKILALRIDDPE